MSLDAMDARAVVAPSVGTANLGHASGKRIRVMFVEDDPDFREAASFELEDLGFAVTSFEDGTSLLAAFVAGLTGDVIVLDWGLPGMSGFELFPHLHSAKIDLPVIFLTGRASFGLENMALQHGARDFVDKARGLQILAKRIRRAHRAYSGTASEALTIGNSLALRLRDCRVLWKGVDVGLTLTEYKIIHLLLNTDGPVTYRSVYDKMRNVGFVAGSGEDGYRTNVRSCIKRVRRKFWSIDSTFDCIKNDVGVGYHWAWSDCTAAHGGESA